MPSQGTRFQGGVFLLSLGLMLFELCLTRVLSVLFYYHTAFLAISLALLGLGFGALWVQLFPRRLRGREGLLIAVAALSCALLPLNFDGVHLDLDQLEGFRELAFVRALGLTVILVLVPFVCGGAALALVFEKGRDAIARLYGADLIGAALGTLLLVPVMEGLGGPGGLFFCGVLIAVAGLLLRPSGLSRLVLGAALVTMILLGVSQEVHDRWRIDVDAGTDAAGRSNPAVLFKKWNAFSRVVVLDQMGWERGLSDLRRSAHAGHRPHQREALIDINAFAPLIEWKGDEEEVGYLADLVSNIAYPILRSQPRVAIIGPGCGKDVLGALLFDPEEIVGIELNDILVEDVVRGAFRDFSGGVYDHPRVRMVVGDGRAEIARQAGRFDLLVANSVATWAAHSSGAMNLSEQNLYTEEAFRLYASKLRERGMVSISLWDESNHTLPLRLATTWQAACSIPEDALSDHLAIIANPWDEGRWFTTVLLSRAPLRPDQCAMLEQLADELGFEILSLPGKAKGDPRVREFLRAPAAGMKASPYDLRPASDDHPFFFYSLRPSQALRFWEPETHSENVAYFSLVVSLGLVSVLVVFALGVPWLVERRRRKQSPRSLSSAEIAGFAGIGAGFLFVEIAIIQRLTLFLGHPTYALTVTLFGVLAWSGIGSRLVGRMKRRPAPATLLFALIPLLGLWWFGADRLCAALEAESVGLRIAATLGLLAPLALAMGMPMPLGLSRVREREGVPVAWALGINGATGVLASIAGILVAILGGFSATFSCGVACYLMAGLAWRRATPVERPTRST